MAKQTIIVGNTVNDGTGDSARNAFIKANQNFDELYAPNYILIQNPTFDTGYKVNQDWYTYNNVGRTNYTRMSAFHVANAIYGIEVADQTNAKKLLALQPYGGNVSVGSTASNDKLHIIENVIANTGITKYGVRATSIGLEYGGRFLGYLDQGIGSGIIFETIDSGTATERIRINQAGNVGIGTSNPGTLLDVVKAQNASTSVRITNVDNGSSSDSRLTLQNSAISGQLILRGTGHSTPEALVLTNGSTTGPLYLQTQNTARMTIDSSGNVGIGSTTPQDKLHIVGSQRFDIGASRSIAQVAGTNHIAGNAGSLRLGIQDGSGISGVEVFNTHNGTYSSQDIRFSTAEGGISPTTERMRIAKDGNVGIGTGAPGDKLTIIGSGSTYVLISNGTASLLSGVSSGAVGVVGTTSAHDLQIYAKGAARLFVGDTGTFVAGFVAPSVDNAYSCGGTASRWTVVYAVTGTINTSDATMKSLRDGTPIGLNYKVSSLAQSELNAAVKIADEIGVYKWQDAIVAKGEDARLHIGLTVQRAIEIMESEGLDPFSYGFICKDEVTKKVTKKIKKKIQKTKTTEEVYTEIEIINGVPTQVEKTRTTEVAVTELVDIVNSMGEKVMDSEGNVQQHPVPVMVTKTIEEEVEVPDGVRYGFRYDQLSMFVIKGLAEKIKAV